MSEWKPIATADRERHLLLLGVVRNGILQEVHIGGFRWSEYENEVSCWWSDQDDDEIVPTHWSEIPKFVFEPQDAGPPPKGV